MKTFFLYRPLFRLLTPVLMGSLAYLLLLLVNNNVAQLTEEFLSNELYFCWGVCLLMQETNRLVLRRQWAAAGRGFGRQLLRRIVVAYVLGLALVSVAVWAYFRYHLGYAPDRLELLILLGIFGGLGWVQMLLYGSQQYVHQSNEEQLLEELELKASVQADFHQFKRGINPQLLFESLEATIVCLYQDPDRADEILDQLATIYRYVLGKRRAELVPVEEELQMVEELLALFNFLPYRGANLVCESPPAGAVVPGTFLQLMEHVIRTRIVIPDQPLTMRLGTSRDYFEFRFQAPARLGDSLLEALEPLQQRYTVYSTLPWKFKKDDNNTTCIRVPRLVMV